jgi:hypothetical protein
MSTAWTEQDRAHVFARVGAAAHFPGVQRDDVNGHVSFSVGGRRFAWLQVDHHGDDRLTLCVKAPLGEQEALIARGEPFFVPSYLGSKGWVGVDLAPGAAPDWDEASALLEQGWRMVAAKKLVDEYDGRAESQ